MAALVYQRPAAADRPEAPKVLLVYPAEAEPSVSAALVRVRGELVADGFEVVLVSAKPGTSSEAAMGDAEKNVGSATVGLFLSADGANAELWVVDKLTDKIVVRRVNTASESSSQLSEVLAVRAVELLRASLLEFLVAQRQVGMRAPTAPPPKGVPVSTEVKRRASEWARKPLDQGGRDWWSAEFGPGLLFDPGQMEPQLGFVARVRSHILPALHLRLSSIGLGTRPRVVGTGGSATVQRWYGLAEIVVLPWPVFRVRPLFTLGVGTQYLGVDGEATWPYRGVESSVWTFAMDAGAGVQCKVSSRLSVVAEGHSAFSVPYPGLRFTGKTEVRVGQPTLMASVALQVLL